MTALFDVLPRLAARVPWAEVGEWPTPVERIRLAGHEVWVKRDDVSGRRYGGSKVRTLEPLFGQAQARGARVVVATGAVGSNHALATVMLARDAGLEPAAMLFPQPPLDCARENLLALLSRRPRAVPLPSWATLPLALAVERARAGPREYVMVPGGATAEGALGYVSAAFELAVQVAAGVLPEPARIIVGVGSTCTSAGLLAGLAACSRLGLGLRATPEVWSVRVVPWPVTSARRIVSLAARAGALLAEMSDDPRLRVGRAELAPGLRVVGGQLGRGYGYATRRALAAIAAFRAAGGPPLDACYSGKAAAALLADLAGGLDGPTLFWATKSSRPLPAVDLDAVAAAPPPFRRWLEKPLRPPSE